MFIKTKWKQEAEPKKKKKTAKDIFLLVLESIRHRWASFDTLMQLTPFVVINVVRWLLVSVFIYGCSCYVGGIEDIHLFAGSTYLAKFCRLFVDPIFHVDSGVSALWAGMLLALWRRVFFRITEWLEDILIAVYLFLIEYKRMVRIPFYRKILYCLTWPAFDTIGRFTTYIAVFKKVGWKTIPHESKVTIDDLRKDIVSSS